MSDLFTFEDRPLSEVDTSQELLHYGILGMKWGIRRDRKTLARLAGREEGPSSENSVRRSRKKDKSSRRTLTPEELKARIDKLKLERELAQLTNDDLAPARTFLARVGKDVAQQTLKTVGVGLAVYSLRAILEKNWDPKEAAKYMMPKKK